MIVVKIGGGESINLDGVVGDLSRMEESYVVVHGANAARDALARALGREKKVLRSVSGYASVYSDEQAIDLLMMAYAGLRNKRLVEGFQRRGVNAVGLSGLDGRLIQGRRNRGIRVREHGKPRIVRDLSGKPVEVNARLLWMLLEAGYVPVIAVPIVDEHGHAINSENDDIVGALQPVLRADRILHLIEAPGLLADPADPGSILRRLSPAELRDLEERSEGRIRRKLLAIRRLVEGDPVRVIVADGRVEHPVEDALAGGGTLVDPEGP